MKNIFFIIILIFSYNSHSKICNKNGKCWDSRTMARMKKSYCAAIGKKRFEIAKINNTIMRTEGFDLRENFDLINCYKKSLPLNISQTIIMRDRWPGDLSPYLCYASRNTNLKDLRWVKEGIKKRRFHWNKYLKTYEFALRNRAKFAKYCNRSAPYGARFRN
ncbi:MAG: hypothetical protein DRQ88_03470 [Epsilonproteobacteria bacterium]|nr:MAG: hypothetical protein DRQ88_03470 [Campylobacterota bacterium]